MDKPLSQEQLNPWLTAEQLEDVRLYYTTFQADGDGKAMVPRYGSMTVRRDITKLVAEVKRLQAIEQHAIKRLKAETRGNSELAAEIDRYKEALSVAMPIVEYQSPATVEIINQILEGVNDHE